MTLDNTLLYKETPSSFGSISLTMQHMNDAQDFWFAIIAENNVKKSRESIKSVSADITMNNLLQCSLQIFNNIERYGEEELLKKLPSNDMVQSRYEFILHVINHNTYHRGQIVTMSRALGVLNDIPATDYEVFLWSERGS